MNVAQRRKVIVHRHQDKQRNTFIPDIHAFFSLSFERKIMFEKQSIHSLH